MPPQSPEPPGSRCCVRVGEGRVVAGPAKARDARGKRQETMPGSASEAERACQRRGRPAHATKQCGVRWGAAMCARPPTSAPAPPQVCAQHREAPQAGGQLEGQHRVAAEQVRVVQAGQGRHAVGGALRRGGCPCRAVPAACLLPLRGRGEGVPAGSWVQPGAVALLPRTLRTGMSGRQSWHASLHTTAASDSSSEGVWQKKEEQRSAALTCLLMRERRKLRARSASST